MARKPLHKRRLIRNRRAELWLGYGLFAAGILLLHDAYENRGVDQPLIARPLLPF